MRKSHRRWAKKIIMSVSQSSGFAGNGANGAGDRKWRSQQIPGVGPSSSPGPPPSSLPAFGGCFALFIGTCAAAAAALLRFVTHTETEPEVQYDNRTRKRRSDDDDTVHETLLQLCGNDSWSPALCGYAHKLKRPKLQLYDDVVRNAMLGVY
jgi:hypothetical protein